MARTPVSDVIVLLPGITGSVLRKDRNDVWALSGAAAVTALKSRGASIKQLELHGDDPDVDDLGDGITAPSLVPGVHLIPGLWKIDGYRTITTAIREHLDVTPGLNFFEFPYDWRRDNRVHARRLARESHDWLKEWRRSSGNDDAKLVLVGHSMGGLISRQFLELHEGWRDTRLLITFGTPYRGSLNALDFVVNGMSKRLGPITLANLSAMLRSFTSVYQLLPIYPCVAAGGDSLARVAEVEGIPNLDRARAADALTFHRTIAEAVDANRDNDEYRRAGYTIKPIAGIFQPTSQSAVLKGDRVEILRVYEGRDQGGDGTVPSVSATPYELSNMDAEIYVRERHASLQNADFSIDQVIGLLRRQQIDQARAFAPGSGVSLELEDAYLVGEPVVVRAEAESEWATLRADLENAETGEAIPSGEMRVADDGWHEVELPPLAEGAYRVTVSGEGDVNPVTDVFGVFAEGTDVEL